MLPMPLYMIKHDLPAKEMTALEVQEQKWGELAPLSPTPSHTLPIGVQYST